jgi:hypothetical protein
VCFWLCLIHSISLIHSLTHSSSKRYIYSTIICC